ncbi:MAG: septal ring lytic transglycosylase RlpA family protein [Hyphomonadaceae bacterium]|nr:septal ring lytic transglycosylase RlpA family protein [Hyphomonadaceae bacterium]
MIWACLGGAAAAERAPIVYAGQGAPTAAAGPAQTGPVQLIASADARLTGGSDTSYGDGARAERGGAVIDIRRTPPSNSQSTTPAWRAEPPVEPVAIAAQAPAPQPAPPTQPEQGQQPWLERERVGPPYQAEGRWYVPTPEPGYAQTGLASWYGPDFHGRATATGETYDQHALTAAHPTLPLNSLVQVTNLENGREVIVRINDRGPFVGERLIDMSRAGAQVLGFEQTGTARVHVRYLGPAPRRVNAEGAPAPAPVAAAQVDGPTQLWPSAPEAEAAPQPAWNAPTVQQTSYAPAPRAPADSAFMVQVGAFSDPANAQRVRATVESEGPVEVDVRHSASGAELFRVRLGPFSSREEADAARRSLVGMGYPEAVVAQR